MKIFSNDILTDGYLDKKFGSNTQENDTKIKNMVAKSFHVGWEDLPDNTKSIAIIFEDHDAIPVCGFTWIHWTACNIDPSLNELPDNASLALKNKFIQGVNSYGSPLLGENQIVHNGYGGCAPPNDDHNYTLSVYALDTMLDLKNGFFKNELLFAMHGHILDRKIINIKYKKLIV
ncbi:MAG: YbhB/YbcL family Raf kinase inhibitor-like protein [Malacoplasma sp.]